MTITGYSNTGYSNFDLLITRVADGYNARVIASPAGRSKADFSLPFTQEALRSFFWVSKRTLRHLRPTEESSTTLPLDPKAFGARLYESVFAGEVGQLFVRSLDMAEDALRIRLIVEDDSGLADLPWEFLYSTVRDHYIALSPKTPVLRYPALYLPESTLTTVQPPLRILCVVSKPKNVPELEVEREWQQLETALADLKKRDLLELERLSAATWAALQQRLQDADVHILHFMGHGDFDAEQEKGQLIFEDDAGNAAPLDADEMGTLLRDHKALRLAFLNSCQGAQGAPSDPFAGVAQKLVQQGVPSVLAMQFPISDKAAIALSREFYGALSIGYPVDAALGEARKAVYQAGEAREWGAPVLYSRSTDYLIIVPTPDCPYPGMVPFTEQQADNFFGRDREITDAVEHLRLHPFLAVIGPSGSGKSSLVYAGIIPAALRISNRFGADEWDIRILRPGQIPLAALADALHTNPEQLASASFYTRTLLFVDQFEELFTLAETGEAQRFLDVLNALNGKPNLYIILTVRADYYPDLMVSSLWQPIRNNRLEIIPLGSEQLRLAILQPAAQAGVTIDDVLVERLVADAADEPGTLPLVQETLVLLWEKMERRHLALQAYTAMAEGSRNGLQVAIGRRATIVYTNLPDDAQQIARRIFLRLIQFGEGRADTRRQQSVDALMSDGDDPGVFWSTLNYMTQTRLLTLSGNEVSGLRQVDIAHEGLITGWSFLQGWIADYRGAEDRRRRLEAQATKWVRSGRGRSGLLDAVELSEAEAWIGPGGASVGISQSLIDLIEASRPSSLRRFLSRGVETARTGIGRIFTATSDRFDGPPPVKEKSPQPNDPDEDALQVELQEVGTRREISDISERLNDPQPADAEVSQLNDPNEDALRATEPSHLFPEVEARYRAQVIERYNRLGFAGLGRLSDIALDDVFVRLTLTVEKIERQPVPGEEGRERSITIQEPITLGDALAQHALIVGEPGAGKSTLLRWLAVTFADSRQRETDRLGPQADAGRLPLLVELGRLPQQYLRSDLGETPHWETFLPEHLTKQPPFDDIPAAFLEQSLAVGRCLLLCDGLDEIADLAARRRIADSLADYARSSANRLVLSSRLAGVSGSEASLGARFQRLTIQRFVPEDVRRFFGFIYAQDSELTPDEASEEVDRLYSVVESQPKTLELATTPLLATLLLRLWNENGYLPERRVELYERCCQMLIESWEAQHDVAYTGVLAESGWERHLHLLAPLAYAIHNTGQRTDAPASELIPVLAQAMQDEGLAAPTSVPLEAEKFLRTLSLRSALLQSLGGDRYSFPHLAFQEYLTARYIAAQPDPEYIDLVMANVDNIWWREVHLLVVEHLESSSEGAAKASKLAQRLDVEASQISEVQTPTATAHKVVVYALLVGIDNYRSPNVGDLRSGVNDVKAMASFVNARLNVPDINIRIYTSSEEVREGPEALASRTNIMAGFEWLLQKAQAGDQVIFYYSGHGTEIPTIDPGKHPNSLDFAILSCDARTNDPNGNTVHEILEQEIRTFIDMLENRGVFVTMFLDCSHSGHGISGEGQYRIKTKESSSDTPRRSLESLEPRTAKRLSDALSVVSPDEVSNFGNFPIEHVLVAACRGDQLAHYYKDTESGNWYGAATYFLLRALRDANGGTTWRQVYAKMRSWVNGAYANQMPELEGSANRTIFGDRTLPFESYPLVEKVESDSSGTYVYVNGGQPVGLDVGSRIELYPPTSTDLTGMPLTKGMVESLDMDSIQHVWAKVTHLPADDNIPLFSRVKIPTLGNNEQVYSVAVDDPLARTALIQWIAAFDGEGPAASPIRMTEASQNQNALYKVETRDDRFVVTDSSGAQIVGEKPPRTSEGAQRVIGILEHMLRYDNVRNLRNPSTTSRLKDALSVDAYSYTQVGQQGPLDAIPLTAGDAVLEPGRKVWLQIQNNSVRDLYLTVLVLNSEFGIERLYPKRRESQFIAAGAEFAIPDFPPSSGNPFWGNQKVTYKFCVTAEPMSFDVLQLDDLIWETAH